MAPCMQPCNTPQRTCRGTYSLRRRLLTPGAGGLCLVRLRRSRRFVTEASSAHWARIRTAWRCSHEEINAADLPGYNTMNRRAGLASPMSDHRMRVQCSAAGPQSRLSVAGASRYLGTHGCLSTQPLAPGAVVVALLEPSISGAMLSPL